MFFRKKYILAKIEGTYGTDPTPVGADAILTSNLTIGLQQGTRVSRGLDRNALGNDAEIATSRFTTLSFDVELAGSGTAGTAPAYSELLRACGLAETIVASTSAAYDPISASFESVTLYFYVDAQLHIVTGARGNVSISLNRDEIPKLTFNMTGLYNAATEPSLITADTSAFTTPLPVTDTNTPTYDVDSYGPKAEAFSFDLGNNVVYRNVVNGEEVQISDRAPVGQLVIEEVAIATKNYQALCAAGTEIAVNIVHGITAGNIATIAGNQVQLSEPSLSDSDGLGILTMKTLWIPTDTGDDEFQLKFT